MVKKKSAKFLIVMMINQKIIFKVDYLEVAI